MGFDIECIIDIQTYPGEYFCPVCRTLVYPNEAFQSQCNHLYCKPCLAHIAYGSKACPYDGYLVTESDSKPLMVSDKLLVEKIGKVKVHCLFFRSGCTWEGTLSDCTSHCSECSFGSSPVICNRCGIQIVHRQVHDHAQSCLGAYEAQPAIGGVPGSTSSGTVLSAATANINQTVAQSGAQLSQSQNPQKASLTLHPGKNPNQQPIANPQAPIVTPVSVSTPEQWCQQHYQQYAGYDPYQQPHQLYYSLQQQPFQQNQQHSLHVHGQPHSHAYTQPQPSAQLPAQTQPQPQPHPHPHSYPVPQTYQQPHFPPLAQGPPQPQPHLISQAPSQVQVPPQGQTQLHPTIQSSAPNYLVNTQQNTLMMRPQAQNPSQILPPPPHSHPTKPPSYAQAVGLQPAAQHPQVPQYQQPPLQMHHSHASQAHVQPQMHPQPQFQNQTLNQSNLQIQSQAPQYHNQFPQVRPPPPNQPTIPAALPQSPHIPASGVSGHHSSYQQPQPAQQMQSGASQQYPIHLHPTSGPFHPVKVHGTVPQQPAVICPPPSHGFLPLQQLPTFLPPQSQVPGIPPSHQQFSTHAQPPTHPPQHVTVMQPVQQAVPQQFEQQQPFLAPVKGPLLQQSHFPQQQPLQPHLQPYGPPRPQHSQIYVGRPMMSNEGMHPQNCPQSSGGFGTVAHAGPEQPGSKLTSTNQILVKSTVLQKEDSFSNKLAAVPDARLLGQGLVEKDVLGTDVKPLKDAVLNNNLGLHETVYKDIVKDEVTEGASEKLSGAISIETRTAAVNVCKEESHSGVDSNLLQQVEDHESQKEAVVLPIPRPQGSEILSHPGHSQPFPVSTTHIGRAPGYFGPPPGSFKSLSAPQGPPLTTLADTHGIMGKAPQLCLEGQYGLQNAVRPSEVATLKDQRSGSSHLPRSGEGVPLRQAYGNEATFWRTNGETALESSKFGLREHLNRAPMESTRPLDQASRSLDQAPQGSSYEAGTKLNSGTLDPHMTFLPPHYPSVGLSHGDVFGPGPEFGRHQLKHFPSRNPDGKYLGISPREFGGPYSFPCDTSGFDDINAREAHRFAEGSRSFNLPSDPVGNLLRGSMFPPISSHLRRGDIDGPKNLRFGERMTRGVLHNHMRSDEGFRQDGPGPLMRGKFSDPGYLSGHFMSEAAEPGTFPGHSQEGELGCPGNFPHHPPFSESVRGDRPSIRPFGEPGIRSSYSLQGFPNAGNFIGEMDSFDQLRKRKPISMGWCRICKIDCDTVEGLEMHAQTREHQKMAMDIVKTIRQRNKKKQRTSAGHMTHEGGSSSRKVVTNGHGNKP